MQIEAAAAPSHYSKFGEQMADFLGEWTDLGLPHR